MTQPIAVLLTSHFYRQKRRGSMHWLADELVRAGWHVRFMTVGYSRLSRLIGDVRLKALEEAPKAGRYPVASGVEQVFYVPPFHPIDLRRWWANAAAKPFFSTFPLFWRRQLKRTTADASLVVVESGLSLMLTPMLRRITGAKLVYRVNDDIQVMRVPPILRDLEHRHASAFDRISLASPILAKRFSSLGTVGLDPMGLDPASLADTGTNPYAGLPGKQVVCAGTSHFDAEAVLAFSRARPEWGFHIIGRLRRPIQGPNITTHGELPFTETIPFIRHADFGIAPYLDVPGVEYQVHHSNRLKLYSFFHLPTAAPTRMLHPDAPFLVGYDASDPASIARAAGELESRTWSEQDFPKPATWADLAQGVLQVLD